jgi:hypothetical protein
MDTLTTGVVSQMDL